MGKKRIIQESADQLIKQKEQIDSEVKKDPKVMSASFGKNGRIYISSSYNNTIVTLTDVKGNVLTWASAGSIGFKGSKKSTPFAASKVAEAICNSAGKLKIGEVEVYTKGIGSGRDSALRSLATHGLSILSIKDVTPVPHNGCRPPKVRRV
jgi:small subunit ribosomal protein S11